MSNVECARCKCGGEEKRVCHESQCKLKSNPIKIFMLIPILLPCAWRWVHQINVVTVLGTVCWLSCNFEWANKLCLLLHVSLYLSLSLIHWWGTDTNTHTRSPRILVHTAWQFSVHSSEKATEIDQKQIDGVGWVRSGRGFGEEGSCSSF